LKVPRLQGEDRQVPSATLMTTLANSRKKTSNSGLLVGIRSQDPLRATRGENEKFKIQNAE
jgi:hypothetical protein